MPTTSPLDGLHRLGTHHMHLRIFKYEERL